MQILYGVDISYVDKTLIYSGDKSGKSLEQIDDEATDIIDKLTGDRQYNDFGPIINNTLHKLYPKDTFIEVLHASVSNWTSYDFEHDPILPNGIHPAFDVEVNHTLSEKEQKMLVDAVNSQITEQLSAIFLPNATSVHKRDLSGPLSFNKVWNPDNVKQYFEEKEKAEQEEKEFLQSLEPPQPYPGEIYKVELPFTLAAPVQNLAAAELKMNEVSIKNILNEQLKYTSDYKKPRVIIGTNVSLSSETEGTLQIQLTKPLKECGAGWINTAKYQFAKDGVMTKCIKENNLIDMSVIRKGRVFETVGNKFTPVEDNNYDDFAKAVAGITEESPGINMNS